MTKRPNLLVTLGAALFLIGGAIVFLVLRNGDGTSSAADRNLVPVLVATTDLSAGEAGDAILASGRVVVKQVPLDQRKADAITSSEAMAGQTLAAAVPSGAQVAAGSLRAPNLRAAAVVIPKGKQAVAVTVNFTSGVAGYAAAGDRVNVYTIVAPNAPNATPATAPAPPGGDAGDAAAVQATTVQATPFTKLLLSNVQVLDISNEVAPRVAAASSTAAETDTSGSERVGGATLTLLLALDAQQAEQLIFATSVNQLYFTVLAKDQGPSVTRGVGYGTNYPVPSQPDAGTGK